MKLKLIVISLVAAMFFLPAVSLANTETRIVIDDVGREVSVPLNITKIAALDPFAAELLVIIGAGDWIVSCPNGVKRNRLLHVLYPSLSEIPVVHPGGSINAEELLALKPDVVLLKHSIYSSAAEVRKLERLGIPFLVVRCAGIEDQLNALALIGSLTGGKPQIKAGMIIDYYRQTLELAAEKAQLLPNTDRIAVFHSYKESLRTDGPDSGAEWIELVGCKNVSLDKGLRKSGSEYYASLEQVYEWNPDAIICNDPLTVEFILNNAKWQSLKAVGNSAVYAIPVGVTRWGQQTSLETFFGMLWLGQTMYPEIYADVDLKTEVIMFYKKVYELELDDVTYEMIMSGQGIRATGGKQDK